MRYLIVVIVITRQRWVLWSSSHNLWCMWILRTMDFYISVVVQNSIIVDQKHRHDIPRHEVRQVETFTSLQASALLAFICILCGCSTPSTLTKYSLLNIFRWYVHYVAPNKRWAESTLYYWCSIRSFIVTCKKKECNITELYASSTHRSSC